MSSSYLTSLLLWHKSTSQADILGLESVKSSAQYHSWLYDVTVIQLKGIFGTIHLFNIYSDGDNDDGENGDDAA